MFSTPTPTKFNLLGYNLVFYTNIMLFNFRINLVDGMRLNTTIVTISLKSKLAIKMGF
jgi:hypothetical protein